MCFIILTLSKETHCKELCEFWLQNNLGLNQNFILVLWPTYFTQSGIYFKGPWACLVWEVWMLAHGCWFRSLAHKTNRKLFGSHCSSLWFPQQGMIIMQPSELVLTILYFTWVAVWLGLSRFHGTISLELTASHFKKCTNIIPIQISPKNLVCPGFPIESSTLSEKKVCHILHKVESILKELEHALYGKSECLPMDAGSDHWHTKPTKNSFTYYFTLGSVSF